MSVDLFEPVIPEDRFHPQFRDLRNSPWHETARRMMTAIFARRGSTDRNFRQDFQGDGFHARVNEICCHAYLESAGFRIDRSFAFPDLLADADSGNVAIEVVTSNPSDGEDRDVSVGRLAKLTDEEVHLKASNEFPRRILRGLTRKLRKKYHELPHVAGRPLVFLVAPFHEAGASFYIEDSLLPAIFPVEPNPPETPFFELEGAEDVSAIAYCNAFSVSKIWRMADPAFIADHFIAEREGQAFFEGRENVHRFRHRVGHPITPIETWFEGVTLFINPFANEPLADGVLPASSTISATRASLDRRIRGFHPLVSTMMVYPRS